MLPKRLLALTLFAALAVMPACALRAQWVQTNGPYGGNVTTFAVSGVNLFVVTKSGTFSGVSISTDNGTSWAAVNKGFPVNINVTSIAAIGSNLFAAVDVGGFYRSTNNGSTWSQAGFADTAIYAFWVSATNIFAATSSGVFLSTNQGIGWVPLDNGLPQTLVTAIIGKGTTLFALVSNYDSTGFTEGGELYRSTDFGSSWADSSKIEFGITSLLTSDSYLYAGTSNQWANSGGVFLSTDSGATWKQSGLGSEEIASLAAIGTNLFAGTPSDGVFRSTDSGKSWTPINAALWNNHVTAIAAIGTNIFAGTNGGGVYLSTDNGASWAGASTGLSQLGATVAASGDNLFAETPQGFFRSTDDGSKWNAVNSGVDHLRAAYLWVDGTDIFASFDSGIFITTNEGTDWQRIAESGLPSSRVIALAGIGTNIFAGVANGGVFRSTDSGTNWTNASTGLTNNVILIQDILVNGAKLFVGTYDTLTKNYGVFLSINNGTSWSEADYGLPDEIITSFAVIGANIFAGTWSDGVFRSSDNGSTWASVDTSLGFGFGRWIDGFAVSGTNLFAATEGGVYHSTEDGARWTSVSSGLPLNRLTSDDYDLVVCGSYLFAGIENVGVWRRPLSDFGISSVTQTQTATAPLIRIYPNPFSQSTTLTFTSEATGYANVSIVNLLGVEVAHLFSGELAAGEHSFAWSNPIVPDGMYECLVRMNGRVKTLPMVLAR